MELISSLRAVAGVTRSNVWILEGEEASSKLRLKILFAGGARQKDYIARLVFAGRCNESFEGKLYLWRLLWLLHGKRHDFSAALIEGRTLHRKIFQRKGDFYLPLWVTSTIELPLTATNKSSREDMRRIRKHGLAYEVTREHADLRDFYENMYLPTISDRHGNVSFRVDFDELKRVVSKGDNQLLLIKHGAVPIAGVAIVFKQELPQLWLAGVRDSSNDFRRIGAVGATYYFPANYLFDRGYKEMGLGRTRPFYNDGVMQYKCKWRHRFTGFDRDGMVFKLLSKSAGLREFLSNQPFFCLQSGILLGTLFTDEYGVERDNTARTLAAMQSIRGLAGVDRLPLAADPWGAVSAGQDKP